MEKMTLKDLPQAERPRERLIRYGSDKLSLAELLAIIIGKGTPGESVSVLSSRLLSRFGDLNRLEEASIEELTKIKGIGEAKATQIKAALELGRRLFSQEEAKGRIIQTAEDVYKSMRAEFKNKKKEHFNLVLLNTRNQLIRKVSVTKGTLNASLIHPREVFKSALSHSAASVILVHNHPSGDPRPSDDDIKITKRLIEAGKIMGIEVHDHVILAGNKYTSLKAQKHI
ncbi:DNA repair protein RadC [bacterium]|nr:DNA repair protein RadC [bacterium]MBU4561271.1 DNA repair protein RadC [bacterium]MCG2675970.1 DNA repair protein RadC [bacterium]MCG2678116.1 DNA repair protein RadC [bacterium]